MSDVIILKDDQDIELIKLFSKVQELVENYIGHPFYKFTPVRYTSQTVNGIIYRIQFKTGDEESIYVKIITP